MVAAVYMLAAETQIERWVKMSLLAAVAGNYWIADSDQQRTMVLRQEVEGLAGSVLIVEIAEAVEVE
jgi:hypothetical protein